MFTLSKRLNKLLACFLAALLLMSHTLALVPVYAAASAKTSEQNKELPEITLDKQAENQSQIGQAANTEHVTTKQKVVQFLNQLIPYYAQSGKQQGPQWLKTTDINFTFTEDFKPIYSLETIQPFAKEVTDGKLGFWQGRYAYQSGANSTANLGIGLRWLSEDKTSITGINTFYDYGFKHDLSRVGIGAEYFNKQTEYRANFYIPTSGDRQTGTTALAGGMLYSYIRAVSGFDYEVGSTLANAPWLSFYASGFHYDNKHKEDENGYRLRSKMQLTPRLSMEMGYTNSNLTSGSLYGKVLYQLADTMGPALHGGSSEKLSGDISHKLLQKVQRENDIKTETFTKLVVHTGNLSVTVTNTSGAALQGAQVQAYQNSSPVGAAAATDANGIALLSGLTTGEYTVRADYFSVSGNSPVVTVQKDQTATTAISLAVLGGSAIINVVDNAGAGVGGATVTAEAVSGLHGAADKSFFDRIFGVKTAYAAATFTVTAVTDANGIARFTNLPPGNYKFTVTYSGKEMKSLAVAVPDGSTSDATVVLPASGGNIVAMIIDAVSETAISGAAVELKSGSAVIATKTTGNDGTATFSGLTAGAAYTVSASAANYVDKSISTTITDKETVAAAIALTPQTGGANITVKDNSNAPLSGASVSVTVNGQPQTAVSDANGVAAFTNLPTGTHTFTASKADYSSNTASATITGGATAAATVTLTRQVGNATITVIDGTNPLSGASVSVTVNGQAQTATTAANGVATFANIPTGTYTFTATKAGYGNGTANGVAITVGTTATATIALARQTGSVKITVTDGTNPLSGATVSVTVNGQVQTGNTAANGEAVAILPTGTYTFTATMAGYGNGTAQDVAITVGAMASATIALARQTGSATITVTDGTLPLSGATVSVTVNGQAQTATTAANGEATFTSIPTGTYTFTATKADYGSGTANGVAITVGTTANATIALARQTGNAKITVTDGTAPLSGATVNVTVNGQAQTATTAANGEATFTSIPTGTYTFTATKADYGSGTASDLTIANGTTATAAIALTRQTGSAKITVTDGTAPLSGASVSVTVNGQAQTATTAANGEATFATIPTGTYTFTATKAGYGSGTASDLTIANGATATAAIALTRQTGDAKITVTDGTAPLSGVTVSVTANGQAQTAITAANGEATFANIPTGTYTFTATKAGYGSGIASDVVIANGATATAAIALTRQTGGAKITVTDGTAPLSGVVVKVTVNGQEQTATSAADGEATFANIPTGTYTFTATKAGYGSGTASDVAISDGTAATTAIALTRQTGNAKITVTDGDIPISGITVSVTLNGQVKTETTNTQGEVTFTAIPTGQYTFTAASGFASGTAALTIEADATANKTIVLPAMGSVNFTVNNGSGPVSGAKISVIVSGNTIDKYSGADGKASFTNLPVGNYTFEVTSTGYESKSQSVTISRNTTGNVSLTINKIITVQVHVKDGSGNNVYQPSVRITGTGVDETKTATTTGIVTFSVPAGTYVVTATKNEYNSDSNTISISDVNNSVELTLVHKVGNVTFTVKDKEGRPISGVTIGKSYSDIVYGTTDATGKFTVNDVPTNVTTQSHYFSISKDGYQGWTWGVTVREGDNAEEVVLNRLPGKAQVTVKSGSQILTGAKVSLADGSSKNTNVYGYARFDVTSGEVTFTASMPGYVSKTIQATIPHGTTYTPVEINLTALDPATLVTLTVNSNYDPALNNVVLYLRDENGFDIAASSKTGSQMIFSGLVPNSSYTIIGKYAGAYRSEFDQDVNMGSTDKTVAYNKFQ